MISTGVLSLEDDMKFSTLVLSKHPRSAETFAHRCGLMFCVQKLNLNNIYHKVLVPEGSTLF